MNGAERKGSSVEARVFVVAYLAETPNDQSASVLYKSRPYANPVLTVCHKRNFDITLSFLASDPFVIHCARQLTSHIMKQGNKLNQNIVDFGFPVSLQIPT